MYQGFFLYKNIHIKNGAIVSVPTFALHYDEDNYSNPRTFVLIGNNHLNKKKNYIYPFHIFV